MTNIRPDSIDLTPEARQAGKLASLERRLAAVERRTVTGPQRAYDEELAEIATTWVVFGGEDLGGPSVTVHVEAGQFVFIYWQCDLRNTAPGGGDAELYLFEPTDFPVVNEKSDILLAYHGGSGWYNGLRPYGVMLSNPFLLGAPLDYKSPHANPVSLSYAATPGDRTYSLRYRHTGGAGQSFFRNRKLWVIVV